MGVYNGKHTMHFLQKHSPNPRGLLVPATETTAQGACLSRKGAVQAAPWERVVQEGILTLHPVWHLLDLLRIM